MSLHILPPLAEAPEQTPAATYLSRLPSPRSRLRMDRALRQLASFALFSGVMPGDPARVPWAAFEPHHTTALVRRLDALHPATQRVLVSALRGVLRAAGADHTAARPSKGRRVYAGRALSLEELRRLKRAARANLRDAALVTILAEGGLRVSELVGADAANWAGDTLRIIGKGNRERAVPFEAPHALIVSTYLEGRTAGPLVAAWKGERAGERLTVRGVQQVLATLAKRAKLGRVSPHDLRRTCLTLGNAAGVPIQHLAALAGHSNTSTTALYIRPNNLELSREAARRKHAFYTEHAARQHHEGDPCAQL